MKLRIRFEKTGPVRFVGHLDFMRTMQKSVRRSGLPAVYTKGFSPHMLMSFAVPLGVGEETTGDYLDLEVALRDPFPMDEKELYRLGDLGLDNETLPECPPSGQILCALNAVMPEGVRMTDIVRTGLIRSSKAMALVRAASYDLYPETGTPVFKEAAAVIEQLMKSPAVLIQKKTKKGTREVDIRPLIRSLSYDENAPLPEYIRMNSLRGECIHLTCDTGSVSNLKPDTVLSVLAEMSGKAADEVYYRLVRRELYDEEGHPLLALGQRF